jgi:hypothetical protein
LLVTPWEHRQLHKKRRASRTGRRRGRS